MSSKGNERDYNDMLNALSERQPNSPFSEDLDSFFREIEQIFKTFPEVHGGNYASKEGSNPQSAYSIENKLPRSIQCFLDKELEGFTPIARNSGERRTRRYQFNTNFNRRFAFQLNKKEL